jgi:small subunit ribosomal protein S1
MVDRNLLREFDIDENELERQIQKELGGGRPDEQMTSLLASATRRFSSGQIVPGRIVGISGDYVIVDVGYKSEGLVPRSEFSETEPIPPGQVIDVLLEGMDDTQGVLLLSKRKAERIKNWERIVREKKEGDVVTGEIKRKTKGGLMVDLGGVQAFLPSSQVDIRRPGDLGEWLGKTIECVILRIDERRRNIVVSRRKLLEERRERAKRELLATLKDGDVVKGVVKNLTEFGAFIDLGGIDGLLHITDMSWGRINHPSEILQVDQEVQVKVLHIDRQREKIALGLKQLLPSPWDNIEQRYPVGAKVKGRIVNVTNYGAFVELEPHVEGLVHISEMSWTRRTGHPSELVQPGDEVEVVVLRVNPEKQEISLGMKQAQPDPWQEVPQKYAPGTRVKGVVKNITSYGAFLELEPGVEGLVHLSDMSWTRKISHPSEMVKKGQELECVVLEVDTQRRRLSLGLKQLREDPWIREIPSKYREGQIVKGKVTKLTNFGAFVELEPELEGLLHISELSDKKVDDPREIVQPGDEIEVRVLSVDPKECKIRLSLRQVREAISPETTEAPGEKTQSAALRGGLGDSEVKPLLDPAQFGLTVATPSEPSGESVEPEASAPENPPSQEQSSAP